MRVEFLVMNREKTLAQTVVWEFEQSFTIGRTEGDIRINDAQCSRKHVSGKVVASNALAIKDLGSRNGTYYGSKKSSEFILKIGESFSIGDFVFKLTCIGEPALDMTARSMEVLTEGYDKYARCMPKSMQGKI